MSKHGAPAPGDAQYHALAAFVPQFEAPDFDFGHWEGGERKSSGAMTLPYFVLSETAAAFVQAAYDNGWVLQDFDWPAWKETPEAQRLRDDPASLAAATPNHLRRLLTVVIRQDRFVEGSLAGHFESGFLTSLLHRIAGLAPKPEAEAER